MSNSDWNNQFDKYVGHHSKFVQAKSDNNEIPANKIKVIDSDIGRGVGFNRVSVHHIVLPPQCRTSAPHAESLEEEFIFVLKGQPDLWLNGYIHKLSVGHAVGFPSGTGAAHTFINNTAEDIHLLVAGEKTKRENLCSFPINPEQKKLCDIWWPDAPIHKLGPHLGLPGQIQEHDRATSNSDNILFCPQEPRRKPFHYPGDNETFGEGFRVTDKVGLKALGIWYDYLPPGRRTAFPHAHTHEEEFVYVLKGRSTVWMNGYAREIQEGNFAAFPSNTGIAHTLINDTNEDVVYICIGETQDFPGEKISYPLNPLRQNECLRKGWYWTDTPRTENGNHSGISKRRHNSHLCFKLCSQNDAESILELFKRSPTYFQRVDGCLPTLKTANHAIIDGPKTRSEKYFKEFLAIYLDDEPIGVLDLHANHPEDRICYLGLLLISEDLFGRGIGTKCYDLGEDYIRRALGCSKIRLGISDENDVAPFWEKMGFTFNGKSYNWKGEGKTANVREFDKILA